MARTTQTQDTTQERHRFLLDLLRQQPELTRQEAAESFRNRFNASLSPRLFTQVKEEAQAEAPTPEVEVEERSEESASLEDAAPRVVMPSSLEAGAPKAKAPKAKGTRYLFVDAPREQLVLLERTLLQLQEAGSNVRIDASTERWMVLAVDAK